MDVIGLYGLIAAKTYLQVTGAYDKPCNDDDSKVVIDEMTEVPECYTQTKQTSVESQNTVLVIDAASDIGGTWAAERLYPNLLSQNSYGLYEFSDLPLLDVVPEDKEGAGKRFIAGWKINHYLQAWVAKWNLKKHIRLKWKSKEWELNVSIGTGSPHETQLICDKLILATGLTSVPSIPSPGIPEATRKSPRRVIHAKDIGHWAREILGYEPIPLIGDSQAQETVSQISRSDLKMRSVVIYGGAKSSFDLVHFFAKLHQVDPALHLKTVSKDPVQVHWIIRDNGNGPAWMASPTSKLPNGKEVASDKAASTRFLHYLDPACYEIPKKLSFSRIQPFPGWKCHMEGSWLARLLHGNPLGRWWIRSFWSSVDINLEEFAHVVSCASGIGIANQPDLWETVKSPHVNIYRSVITSISEHSVEDGAELGDGVMIHLEDGVCIPNVDLVVHATGYKPVIPITFCPPKLRLELGLSGLVRPQKKIETAELTEMYDPVELPLDLATKEYLQAWKPSDQEAELVARKTLAAAGCIPLDRKTPSWAGEKQILPYRLFRRMVAPKLVAEGDRSFATIGVIMTSTIAVVAEVQALWITAFLTGGFDQPFTETRPEYPPALSLGGLSEMMMNKIISEEVALGSLTGPTGLEVDAIHVCCLGSRSKVTLAFVNEEPEKEKADELEKAREESLAPENELQESYKNTEPGKENRVQESSTQLPLWPTDAISSAHAILNPTTTTFSHNDESAVAGLLALGTSATEMIGPELSVSDFTFSSPAKELANQDTSPAQGPGPSMAFSPIQLPQHAPISPEAPLTEPLELLRHYRYHVAPWVSATKVN
ncbi:hypothetical protein N7462_006727 [Penicillium macrosclerotiorum]|uniref:uncharacterized protein n=1 Tax=Penicillium macrosclerotiorum TaxID=303699 RepID=UPI00254694C6|nr:uncharacterized protein N7462_006727 [Penicillium macrosclerotiorum]KAJ5683562.1 hypothetical protein N7462_006727 [Penicillium macrosclerotiorum]